MQSSHAAGLISFPLMRPACSDTPISPNSANARPTAIRPRTASTCATTCAARVSARRWSARLLSEATAMGFRQMIAVIGDSENVGSIGVHTSLGFHAGRPAALLRAEVRPLGRHCLHAARARPRRRRRAGLNLPVIPRPLAETAPPPTDRRATAARTSAPAASLAVTASTRRKNGHLAAGARLEQRIEAPAPPGCAPRSRRIPAHGPPSARAKCAAGTPAGAVPPPSKSSASPSPASARQPKRTGMRASIVQLIP